MNTRGPLWKISISTTPEAEDAVTELLNNWFGQPVSSYTDVETGDVAVTVYLSEKRQPPLLNRGRTRFETLLL